MSASITKENASKTLVLPKEPYNYLVGIGASAGGLNAIKTFLKNYLKTLMPLLFLSSTLAQNIKVI